MGPMPMGENAALTDRRLLLISYNLLEKLYIYERKGPLGPPLGPPGLPGGGGGRGGVGGEDLLHARPQKGRRIFPRATNFFELTKITESFGLEV